MGKNQKIALLAPFKSPNFGTLLQAYSLSKYIFDHGYLCEYISFSPSFKRSLIERLVRKLCRLFGWKQSCADQKATGIDDYSFYRTEEFAIQIQNSNEFADCHIPQSKICYNPRTIHRINKQYRKFVVGSDQVWSIERYDKTALYYLPFVRDKSKKYSYASSIGTTSLPLSHTKVLKRYLQFFSKISCREPSNCEMLSGLLRKKVDIVVDPTMLYDRDYWIRFAQKIELPETYILAYVLGEKECVIDFAEKLGSFKNIPVYYVVTRPKYLAMNNKLSNLKPQEWVYAINNASCVVTDSFHGALFSINLNKDFYCFYKRENNSSELNDNDRISELMKQFHLESRLISEEKDVLNFKYSHVIYDKINSIIRNIRESSFKYLDEVIK